MTHPILLFDQTPGQFSDLPKILQEKAISFALVRSEPEARRWLEVNRCRAILLAVPSAQSCLGLLAQLQEDAPQVPVLVASHVSSVGEAVAAFQAGAIDFLEAQVLPGRLEAALARIGEGKPTSGPGRASAAEAAARGCAAIVGNSRKMARVFDLIKKVCDTDTTVLVRGESGTGKELIAQALHFDGVRAKAPFIPVNCGAIPGELLESELFGHEKGAFTHAIRTRQGRFELADGGTVFLDEISEMSPMLQVKLLRVLQEKEFERIGGTRTIRSDFRVIAATNRDLEREVQDGRFREDLYYRLNVIPIDAPPLRERPEDIPLLINHFIEKFNQAKKKRIKGLSEQVLARMLRYPWPGNVRELENTMERMVILAAGSSIDLEDLPERLLARSAAAAPVLAEEQQSKMQGADSKACDQLPEQGFFLNEVMAEFEMRLLQQALDQAGWVKNRAAKLLNINRTTLIEKMKRFKLVSQASDNEEGQEA